MDPVAAIPQPFPSSPPIPGKDVGIRQRAIRGAIWTSFGYGGSSLIRLAGNLVLTRLLVPQIFGLMALVNIFVQGLVMFSDVGIRGSILRYKHKHVSAEFLDTAWTFQVIRGAVLWTFALLLAWPFAKIYDQPELAVLIPVAALTLIISGFNSTALFVQDRKLALGKTTAYALASQFISIIVMIVLAWYMRSVWAFVFGSLVASASVMISSYWLIPHKHHFTWDRDAAKDLIGYGVMIFFSTSALFLANTSERFILGKYISLAMLGIYSIGQGLSTLGTDAIGRLVEKVLYPSYAELIRERPTQALRRYSQSRWLLAGVGIIVVILGGEFGPAIIHFLYDPRYWAAGWMLQIFVVESFCEIVQMPATSLMKASNRPGFTAIANCTRALVQIIGLLVVLQMCGLKQGIWVIACAAGLASVVLAISVAYVYPKLWKQEVLVLLTICATILAAMWTLGAI